ncbi:MAG: SurA N-terminal domain-containing protein [Muribaculaceae bacterium]|nr:SurA N-terminal domain-containing protein [Muribaculaceae bacterium]
MATLEKIRSKSVILFVIIIVALLAFILGDFLTSGRTYFGSGDKMIEANGAQVKLDELNAYREKQGERKGDPDQINQQDINALLVQKLFDKEFDQLGINPTDSELSQAIVYNSEVQQFISSLGQAFGLAPAYDEASMTQNIAAVLERLKNPQKYQIPADQANRYLAIWRGMESSVENSLRQQLYSMLIGGLYAPNDVDAQAIYDGETIRNIDLVMIPSASIADDQITVTDDDIKAVWAKNKSKFAVKGGDKRSIAYIVQQVAPSDADYTEADAAVAKMVADLQKDTLSLAPAQADSRFLTQRQSITKAQLDTRYQGANNSRSFKKLVDSAYVGKTMIVQSIPGSFYTIGKIMGIEQKLDSVTYSQLMFEDGALSDSLMTLAKATQTWDSLKLDNAMAMGNQEISLLNVTNPKISEILSATPVGETVLYSDSIQGQQINMLIRVDKRPAPVSVYDIARIDFVVEPSSATRGKISGDFRNYLGNNATAQAFTENAEKAGYNVQHALVTAGTANIAGLPSTRALVKFAMDGKTGKVSPAFESKVRQSQTPSANIPAIFQPAQPAEQEYLVAVALGKDYDDYVAWDDPAVRPRLEREATNMKKAEKLAETYKDKANDLQALATAAKTTVLKSQPFAFNSSNYPAEVSSAIVKAAKDAVTEIVTTPYGVYVAKINSINDPAMKLEDSRDMYLQQFNRQFMPLVGNGLINALLGGNDAENHSLNFVAGIDD